MSAPEDPFAPPPGPQQERMPAGWNAAPSHQSYAGQPAYGGQPAYSQPAYGGQPARGAPPYPPTLGGYGYGYGGPPGYGPGAYGYGGPGYGPYGHPPPYVLTPAQMLDKAAQRVDAAAKVLWATLLGWFLWLAAGFQFLDSLTAFDEGYDADGYRADENAEALAGFGLLALLSAGAAVWALLALWCSWTARAARASGRVSDVTLSSMAWWGGFVPLAAFVLPVLAYRQTARTVRAAVDSRRTGPPTSEQDTGDVPLLLAWWGLFCLAMLAFWTSIAGADTWERAEGGGLVVCGLLGVASTLCGVVALHRVALTTREAATGTSAR